MGVEIGSREGPERLCRVNLIGAGIIAGATAGVVTAAAAMTASAALGWGLWYPAKPVAVTLFGVGALAGGPGMVVAGLALHLVLSTAAGGAFGCFLAPDVTPRGALLQGLAYGVLLWLVVTHLLLPQFNSVLAAWASVYGGWWLSLHLLFGATLALTPVLGRPRVTTVDREERAFDRAA